MNVIWSRTTGHSSVCLTAYADPHERNTKMPVAGEFPAQRASTAEKASMQWHHHVMFRSRQYLESIRTEEIGGKIKTYKESTPVTGSKEWYEFNLHGTGADVEYDLQNAEGKLYAPHSYEDLGLHIGHPACYLWRRRSRIQRSRLHLKGKWEVGDTALKWLHDWSLGTISM